MEPAREGDSKKSKPRWPIALLVAVGVSCWLACLCGGFAAANASKIYQFSLNRTSLKVGTLAPDFEAPSLSGGTVRLSQFRGEPVLLTFGTTWCPDCVAEAPVVQALHEEHPELVVLLVDSNESRGTVQDFVDEYGLTYPVLLDSNGSISRQYQIFAIPTGLFIDAEGVIQAKVVESVTPELLEDKLPLIGVDPYANPGAPHLQSYRWSP